MVAATSWLHGLCDFDGPEPKRDEIAVGDTYAFLVAECWRRDTVRKHPEPGSFHSELNCRAGGFARWGWMCRMHWERLMDEEKECDRLQTAS